MTWHLGKKMRFLLIIVLLFIKSFNQTLETHKAQVQKVVKEVASKLQSYYGSWCSTGSESCPVQSINGCYGIYPKTCDYSFPNTQTSCLYQGLWVSGMSNLNFLSSTNYNSLTTEQKRFVCSSAQLEPLLQSYTNTRNKQYTYIYIGSKQGMYRQSPGDYFGSNGKCDQYEPRLRPWYGVAQTGAKKIVILIDRSMSASNLQTAKSTINQMIDTLTLNDQIGIVAFTNTAEVVGTPNLLQATDSNKQSLKQAVTGVAIGAGQQIWAGFEKGLALVANSTPICKQAQTVFAVFANGKYNSSDDQFDLTLKIKFKINQNSTNFRNQIILFFFPLPSTSYDPIYKKMACNYRGVDINSTGSKGILSMYQYLQIGMTVRAPVWTQPYQDYYGYGEMVTVSMPAYYTDQATRLKRVIGVVAIDILMQQFNSYGLSRSQLISKLVGTSACNINTLNACNFMVLLQQAFACNYTGCGNTSKSAVTQCTSPPAQSSIFMQVSDDIDNQRCCGIKKNQFIIIMCVTLGVGLIILAVVIFFLCRRRKLKNNANTVVQKNNASNYNFDSAGNIKQGF